MADGPSISRATNSWKLLTTISSGDARSRRTAAIELGGKRFAIFHGHERGFENAPYTLDVDYILHGHSHVARDETLNGIRIINPGALHRARPKSFATLETSTDELLFYELDGV